jgi:ribonuclease PH
MIRPDGRAPQALRPVTIETGVQPAAQGSALIKWGETHVLCAASVEERVPAHRLASGGGWLTAEYSLLPASTSPRARRERSKVGGRTAEIQRLIGRSLRAVIDLDALGPRTVWIDCDVLRADGGTRCASITGAWVAAALALKGIAEQEGRAFEMPTQVSAVSVGIWQGEVVADLCYIEDSGADVDLNYVASPAGIVEIQGTAEREPFSRDQLLTLTDYAQAGCEQLFTLQRGMLT